jgi:hypothetical protein
MRDFDDNGAPSRAEPQQHHAVSVVERRLVTHRFRTRSSITSVNVGRLKPSAAAVFVMFDS